ncbi:vWA domain-containing protein [Roseibacillus ishigakijimensis]|uniref:VWA domain-containing protein n=1 Tax=Roseibacillus ishigakijimensis TaxID=454146 RepID=A0A934RR01_9BACT|nr:VWA domain-containing protein [Roseibacillus ishigakijimensis]MBK1835313.1 VWA domain-containing protein [Roseibacillus ishigakijimensis]
MKRTLLSLLAASPLLGAESPTAIIVLDASGSMWGQIEGKAKIEIARDVISDLLEELPSELELGLVAYGHRRKGDCEDIELLIPPGEVNREHFEAVVGNILPKGMTPLTSAVEFAAEGLNYKENKASVILVTDGLETCDKDPCAVAQALEKQGIDFTAHVVAFDLAAEDALSVECLAKETGGQFLPAGDAASLATALTMAVEDVVAPPEKEEAKEEAAAEEAPVTLVVPESVPAGSKFSVKWEAEGDIRKNDYITIVPADAEEGTWKNYSYAKDGSPLDLTALPEEGPAEVRYLSGETRKTLGRAALQLTPVEASLEAPETAVAGAAVSITWTGPAYPGDFLTIVSADTEEGAYAKYAYAKKGENTVEVLAPITPGPCEIRYLLGQGSETLARKTITITEATATVSAPEKVLAGAEVEVSWSGPMNEGDFITIVPKDTEEGKYAKYEYAKKEKQPAKILAPLEPGLAEVRYLTGQGYTTLARTELLIEEATISLDAPETVGAGSVVTVSWTGPNNPQDFITIVPADAEEGTYKKYGYTAQGATLKIEAPLDAGPAEVRYLSGQGSRTLARIPLTITASEITLRAPDSAVAASEVTIEWTGPNNPGDYLTIVPKEAEDGRYGKYDYTTKGTPLQVVAPAEAGPCEIRYMAGQGGRVLHRIPLNVTASE